MINFQPETESSFFSALGIPYGYLHESGCEPLLALCLVRAKNALAESVKNHGITQKEAQKIEEVLKVFGLLETMDMIFKRILAYVIPADFTPLYCFEICTRCPVPLPHGYICQENDRGEKFDYRLDTKVEGIVVCFSLVENDQISVLDAIRICQQILSSDLIEDETRYAEAFVRYARSGRLPGRSWTQKEALEF